MKDLKMNLNQFITLNAVYSFLFLAVDVSLVSVQ